MDRIKNKHIRLTVRVRRLGDEASEASWIGHMKRRDSEYIVRGMLAMELLGRRKREFLLLLREDMQLVGVTVKDAEDKVIWKRMPHCGDIVHCCSQKYSLVSKGKKNVCARF